MQNTTVESATVEPATVEPATVGTATIEPATVESGTLETLPMIYDVGHDIDDNDSAYGESSNQSETATLSSSILKYRIEAGRTYHSYGKNSISPLDSYTT
jgi:hypothetical protein